VAETTAKRSEELADAPRGRSRFILSSTLWTVPGTLALVGVPFALGWPAIEVAAEPGARLAFALPWCFVALLPYALVCVTIATLRLSGPAHDPLAGREDEALQIHCRVMQNTLEQLVWFVLCLLPLSVTLPGGALPLLPLASGTFVLGRLAYWWGYFRDGTLGRRFGIQVNFTLNGSLLVLVFLAWSGLLG